MVLSTERRLLRYCLHNWPGTWATTSAYSAINTTPLLFLRRLSRYAATRIPERCSFFSPGISCPLFPGGRSVADGFLPASLPRFSLANSSSRENRSYFRSRLFSRIPRKFSRDFLSRDCEQNRKSQFQSVRLDDDDDEPRLSPI